LINTQVPVIYYAIAICCACCTVFVRGNILRSYIFCFCFIFLFLLAFALTVSEYKETAIPMQSTQA